MEEDENLDIYPCKVILVGDSGVGKTSIIGRFLNRFSETENPTVGASYSKKVQIIDNYSLSFDIWDTAGQEQFRAVNVIFYKDASICIMVYDITKPETFENIKSFWYKTVLANGDEDIIYGVVGNKIDLFEEEKVDEKEVKEFCNTIDATLHTASAIENKNIDDIFRDLGKKFINSNKFKQLISQNTANKKQKIELNDKIKKNTSKKKCC